MANIGILTIHDPKYKPLAEITNANKKLYCEQHGYKPLFLECANGVAWWEYVYQERKHIGDYDWLWVTGVDYIVTNPSIKLESFIDENPEADIFISSDVNGFNNGMMLMKNTTWMRSFLTRWLESRKRMGHWTCPEQTALAYLLYTEPKSKWHILAQKKCNSYLYGEYGEMCPSGQWQEGDFALHLPALSLERRLYIFKGLGYGK